MRLVWTYNSNPPTINDESKKILMLNFYILSISRAKKYGHYTVIYTDLESSKHFYNLADEVYILNPSNKTLLWDGFKISALENEKNDFALIDGDIILETKLPELNNEMYIDAIEYNSWEVEYALNVEELTNLKIKDLIPEWENKKTPIINTGFLYIKDRDFRMLYLDRFKKYGDFIYKNKEHLSNKNRACMGAQYLLGLLCEKNNITPTCMSEKFSEKNNYYKHYVGLSLIHI